MKFVAGVVWRSDSSPRSDHPISKDDDAVLVDFGIYEL
jgi:hypothetical protein